MEIQKNRFINASDKKEHMSYEMLREMARSKGLRGLRVNIVQIPSQYNGMHAIADAEVEMNDGIFQEIGDATVKDTKDPDESNLLKTAVIRAKARALKDALGVNVAILEEDLNAGVEEYEDFFDSATMNSRELVITFGKYKNFSLGEIFDVDQDYVEWLSGNSQDLIVKSAAKEIMDSVYDQASNLYLSKH